ncbi:phosphatases II [Obba rivulosa]|uniref:phosphatidylinositol-3,4,5-trisphosphate 3-phosphatase n=1 Tax=Obba rivulosa TaxID=1052685 RepID=A0A8E2DPG2_9APHY|nr:phosphatases II [Obba rivulosa]
MADFVRRLVSGNKARYKDVDLHLELADLAYITDRVIVMGFPAAGIEGFYRNRREDAKKFLEHRHGQNYWVFNFCPVKENSYPTSVFGGRVSRYPFPDHHAPPLAILALVAREIRAWLDGAPERVAVLHCKAGKGRSGTMACAYLLTQDEIVTMPSPEAHRVSKERAAIRAEEVMNAMPPDEADGAAPVNDSSATGDPIRGELDRSDAAETHAAAPTEVPDGIRRTWTPAPSSLSKVLELHTSRRMKRPSSPSKKVSQGVSIPSQRRWLYYWSLLLAHQAPADFWPAGGAQVQKPAPKVRLTQITLRMRALSGVKTGILRAANVLMEQTRTGKTTSGRADSAARSGGHVWVSLARYDDEFVNTLERWERHTRGEGDMMGKRREGSDHLDGKTLSDELADGGWDKRKMVRSFARLGLVEDPLEDLTQREQEDEITLSLRPLTADTRDTIRDNVDKEKDQQPPSADGVDCEETSINDTTQAPQLPDGGVILDANREIRAKLYIGLVFMGWFWFIPTFHMPHPRTAGQTATLHLSKAEIDFPLGIGSGIIEVEVSMEWLPESADKLEPPPRQGSAESERGEGEPAGAAALLHAVAAGVPSATQAAED